MTLREIISNHFKSAMRSMTFMDYFNYLNTGGKITSRSLLELVVMLCEKAEEQEKKEAVYEQNFRDIEEILSKLIPSEPVKAPVKAEKPKDAPLYVSKKDKAKKNA